MSKPDLVKQMLGDGWSVEDVIKYAILLDDWGLMNAAIAVRRASK